MQCPDCDISLDPATLGGQDVDVCDLCRGIWFDAEELGEVIQRETALDPKSQELLPDGDSRATKRDKQAPLACPHCNQPMRVINYAHDSGVMIHTCADCSGAWLRVGQVRELAAYRTGTPAVQDLARAFVRELDDADRWSPVEVAIRSRKAASIVAVGLLVIIAMIPPAPEHHLFRFHRYEGPIAFTALGWALIWLCDLGVGDDASRVPTYGMSLYFNRGNLVAILGWMAHLAAGALALAWHLR